MNEVRTLLTDYWICKDTDKEKYYRVKRDIPKFQKFVKDQLGWKLIHTDSLLKLEKRPAHAEPFMGISEFAEIRDYCILCCALMFLEDREEHEQFLLSELIDYVGTQLSQYMEVDWTSFGQRKSLVRVMQYMERLNMLKVYEGRSEGFTAEEGQEVLYENTGYSRYFATSFPVDISGFADFKDFEEYDIEDVQDDKGTRRLNRVYRQLAVCPSVYWTSNEDGDGVYIKNQRQRISKNLDENLGGHLEVCRNNAAFVLNSGDTYGNVHPRDAMLPDIVLLVSAMIRDGVFSGELEKKNDECIYMGRVDFENLLTECRNRWKGAWSKEYREMDDEKYIRSVTEYMEKWMMIKCDADTVTVMPSAAMAAGRYPDEVKGGDR